MGPELIALILGGLGLSGLSAAWWLRRAGRDHVRRVQTGWVRAGQIVRWGPVSAVSFGHRPRRTYTRGVFGALGITGERVVFDGRRSTRFDTALPLDAVRWIGLETIPVVITRHLLPQRVLALHTSGADGWRVSVFALDDPFELAEQVAALTGLPVHDAGSQREDFGPMEAERAFQDVYGEWSPDRADALYLAPDRLLFGWRDAIPLDRVQRLDALRRGGAWNPLAAGLLRVEHESAERERAVVGFVVRGAERWAEAIQRRIDTPVPVFAGRKQKDT